MIVKTRLPLLLVYAVVCGLLIPTATAKTDGPSPEARKHFEAAQWLFALNHSDRAMKELRAAIAIAPDFIAAQCLLLDKQSERASDLITQFEKYVQDNPESAAFHYLLGKAHSKAGKGDRAVAEFNKALEIDPQHGWSLLALGEAALREGDKEKAAESWRKAGQYAGDDIELRSALAASLLDNRFYDAALEEAEKILRLDSLHIDSYYRKWSAKMNITYGAEETRAEVLRDIRKLESEHHRDVRALAIALSGYEMLDDRKAAARTRKSILSLDPGYFDRQPFDFSFRTPSGRLVHIGGAPARKFNETFTTEDPRARLEIFAQLDKEIEDQNVRLYLLYPQMLSAYVSVADVANARRLLQALIDAGVEGSEIASNQLQVARLCFDTKIDLDLALDYARQSVERLRKPSPAPDLKSPDSADLLALAEEYRLFQLAEALSLQGSILLARGLADQAVSPLEESFRVSEREETALDLGLACAKAGQNQKAIEFLTRAYVYDGKLKGEALKALRSVYGEREKTLKLMLDGAVARHRESMREAAIAQAIREMGRTERKTAPAFELSTLEGRKVALSELAGKIVLMNFWATW